MRTGNVARAYHEYLHFKHLLKYFLSRRRAAEKQQGERFEVCNYQQYDERGYYQRHDGTRYLLQAHVRDAAGDVEVHADGRGHEADGEVHYHDGAEVHRVDVEGHGHGEEQRGEDVQRGGGVEEAARDEQDDVHDEQEDELVAAGDVDERAAYGRVYAAAGEHVGEERGCRRDEHDRRGGGGGVHQQLDELLELYRAVDDHADEQAVDRGDRSGVGRGEHTAVDAAEDDDRHEQAPEGVLEGLPALLTAGLGQAGELLLPAEPEGDGDERRAHDEAGQHAGDKEVADGGVADGAEDDEGDGGRNDDADGAGGGHERRREADVVARLDERGDDDYAEGRDRGRAGAGDGGEEAGDEDADHRDAAAQVADAGLSQVDELARDARGVHDVAAQDEEGYGLQDRLAGRGRDQLGHGAEDDVHRPARQHDQHGSNAGNSEAHRYGGAHEQQYRENYEQHSSFHYSAPPSLFSSSFAASRASATTSSLAISLPAMSLYRFCPKRIVMNSAPMGTKEPKMHSGSWVARVTWPFSYWLMAMNTP